MECLQKLASKKKHRKEITIGIHKLRINTALIVLQGIKKSFVFYLLFLCLFSLSNYSIYKFLSYFSLLVLYFFAVTISKISYPFFVVKIYFTCSLMYTRTAIYCRRILCLKRNSIVSMFLALFSTLCECFLKLVLPPNVGIVFIFT